ncbi:MAG: phosphoribosylglycinamide formyltransferase [bacterium]
MFNIAVFVSGRGSNFQSIFNASRTTLKNIQIKAVVSDRDCAALDFALENKIPVYKVSSVVKKDYVLYEDLIQLLDSLKINLIVLAGFLKKIPDELVDKYPRRIINIHPALLPSFGGKGMYGINVHRAVFDSSAQVSGASVHFVDKIYDNGKIIAQRAVDISSIGSPEQIAERVLQIEHELLPFVIEKISEDKVIVKNNRVYLLN